MSKLHRHLITSVWTAVEAIMQGGEGAEGVVARALQGHPKWGARDRRQFAEQVYGLVRHWRWAGHLAAAEDTPSRWAAWWMQDHGEALPEEFTAGLTLEDVLASAALETPLAVRESLPDWLDAHGHSAYGDVWPAVARSLNQPAEVFLRVNRLRGSVAEAAARLQEEGVETDVVPGAPDALKLRVRRPLQNSATFRAGWCEVQDAGSQQIAPFLRVAPGQTVVDACAGAGGKSLHLAALMRNQGHLLATDVHPRKLAELELRARRNGVVICQTQLISDAPSHSADRVLLDVPCSGLGILRRKVATKWQLTESALSKLLTLQARILQDYSAMVKPGGKLVYATCSLLPAENEHQVATFLAANPGGWSLEEERRLRPDVEGWDGFYMARLVRAEAGPH